MRDFEPNLPQPQLNGASRIYAVFGDPVAQVQTPRMINPLFASHGHDIHAVPFRVTPAQFEAAWQVFAALDNVVGIGVTVPHKIAAARRCALLTDAARAVGAVNCIKRRPDGSMHGALFDGVGFVEGLGAHRVRLENARVLMIGAGGAGRAIAHALAREGIRSLAVLDPDAEATRFTVEMVNGSCGFQLASAPAKAQLSEVDVLINASPVGVKPGLTLPIDLAELDQAMLVADIACLDRETGLLEAARKRGCAISDGNAMLKAQIELIAGFAAGFEPGEPVRQAEQNATPRS
ncbi:ThiF family adenylyltransferase [Nitratireductor sp. GISD-1A_MAKvit]|uniref:shikimate dehydrogenase family protein n=1 Tax=Nitratireductor sp. GISD-1A_MAKvit TaxID=3234198 RepID=UPI003465B8FF